MLSARMMEFIIKVSSRWTARATIVKKRASNLIALEQPFQCVRLIDN